MIGCCLSNLRGDPFQHDLRIRVPPWVCGLASLPRNPMRMCVTEPHCLSAKASRLQPFCSCVFWSFLVNCSALSDSAGGEAKLSSECGVCLTELPLKRLGPSLSSFCLHPRKKLSGWTCHLCPFPLTCQMCTWVCQDKGK